LTFPRRAAELLVVAAQTAALCFNQWQSAFAMIPINSTHKRMECITCSTCF